MENNYFYEIKDENIRPILENRPSIVKDISDLLAQRRSKKKCFVHIAKKKNLDVLEEKLLSKKIFQDISKLFSSIFS